MKEEMNAQQKSPPRETQGLPGLFAASNTGHPHASFTVTVFADQRTCSTLLFCFQLKKEKVKGENKKSKSCPTAPGKNVRQKTCPKLSYIMWPYTTPRKTNRCARRTEKPAGCIRTLCKIAARGADAFVRLSLPFGQGASHRRMEFFNIEPIQP